MKEGLLKVEGRGMDAKELLKEWPGWAKANAARVLASPAWRLAAQYDGRPAVLTRAETMPEGTISLAVRLDDEPKVVTFAPSPLFPDLWALRERLGALPPEVLLALVEKECGPLFQFFEDIGRQSFAISGLSEATSAGMPCRLATQEGEVVYALDLSSEAEISFGQLSNLDTGHESIRSLLRDVTACQAVLEISDEDAASLASGDFLVLPEDASPCWLLDLPEDGRTRLVAPEKRRATFGEIADDALGPVPTAERVQVVRNGKVLASGVLAKVGEAAAVMIS